MTRRAFLPALALLCLAGCASSALPAGQAVVPAAPFLTRKTGELTIKRQEFIDVWTSAQVIFDRGLAGAKALCASGCLSAARCAELPGIEAQAKVARLAVETQLRNPEAEVDWANVAKVFEFAAKFVF